MCSLVVDKVSDTLSLLKGERDIPVSGATAEWLPIHVLLWLPTFRSDRGLVNISAFVVLTLLFTQQPDAKDR